MSAGSGSASPSASESNVSSVESRGRAPEPAGAMVPVRAARRAGRGVASHSRAHFSLLHSAPAPPRRLAAQLLRAAVQQPLRAAASRPFAACALLRPQLRLIETLPFPAPPASSPPRAPPPARAVLPLSGRRPGAASSGRGRAHGGEHRGATSFAALARALLAPPVLTRPPRQESTGTRLWVDSDACTQLCRVCVAGPSSDSVGALPLLFLSLALSHLPPSCPDQARLQIEDVLVSMLSLAQSLSSEDAAFATPSSPHPHHGTAPPPFSPTAVTPFAAPLHEGFDPAGCGVDAFDFEAAARVLTEGRPDDLVHTTIQIPHALVGLVIGVRGGRRAAATGWAAPHLRFCASESFLHAVCTPSSKRARATCRWTATACSSTHPRARRSCSCTCVTREGQTMLDRLIALDRALFLTPSLHLPRAGARPALRRGHRNEPHGLHPRTVRVLVLFFLNLSYPQ